jgi:DNA-binding LacI/PurR family transcriptional regulator
MAEGGVVVSYGWPIPLPCDQVIFDSEKRIFQAAQHLLEMGHRKIGMCFHGLISTEENGDLHGFKRALEQYSVPLRREWLFAGGKYEIGGAKFAAEFLQWEEKPTALCIINDDSASAFINVLAQNGVSVPNDVSVISFDDTPTARYAYVPLTSASYPLQEIAQHVVELTSSRLEGFQGALRRVEVQSHLIERQSCAPPCSALGRPTERKSHTACATSEE